MGFSRRDLELVLDLASRGHLTSAGGIVEFGTQQMNHSLLQSPELIKRASEVFGGPRDFVPPSPLVAPKGGIDPDAPHSSNFWTCLGFRYCCVDLDGSPYSIPLDLNFDSVPDKFINQFGLITNYGTSEHVCNQLNIFKAAHDLAALGGVMIHHLPAGGHLSHGLFNYNFKFFWHLARSNDYEWLYAQFYGGKHVELIPRDIIEATAEYEPETSQELGSLPVREDSIMIALRKRTRMDFVPPLDVENGSVTKDQTLRSRYWTIYRPADIDRVRAASSEAFMPEMRVTNGEGKPPDKADSSPSIFTDRDGLTLLEGILQSKEYAEQVAQFQRERSFSESLIGSEGIALLCSLIRETRARSILEIGTFHGGATRAMAMCLAASGVGQIHTVGPFDRDAFLPRYERWPTELQNRTEFYAMSSMDFFMEARRLGLWFDLSLIDGDHSYEFALHDIQCVARRTRPGGFIVIDNVEQAGPFWAGMDFLRDHPTWVNCGRPLALETKNALDPARVSIDGTQFMVIQAPPFFPVGRRPLTFGDISWSHNEVAGASFNFLPAQAKNTASIEFVLRGFTDNSPKTQIGASATFEIASGASSATVRLASPLTSEPCDKYTIEPWISWAGDSPLRLKAPPQPF